MNERTSFLGRGGGGGGPSEDNGRTQADRFVLVLAVHVVWGRYRGDEVRSGEDEHALGQMSVDAAKSAHEQFISFNFSRIYVLSVLAGLGRTATGNLG